VFESLSFSSDGKLLAAGYANEYPSSRRPNGEIDIWDVVTEKQRFKLENDAGIYVLAFSRDGRMLASGGRFDDRVTLWEVASGMRRVTLRPRAGACRDCAALAFAPDGKTLAVGWARISDSEAGVTLLDLITRRELASLTESRTAGGLLRPAAFTPDARTLAARSGEGFVTLWRIEGPPRGK
jgi:WD40 repeat protein